jgi:hypothetical protein
MGVNARDNPRVEPVTGIAPEKWFDRFGKVRCI